MIIFPLTAMPPNTEVIAFSLEAIPKIILALPTKLDKLFDSILRFPISDRQILLKCYSSQVVTTVFSAEQ